MAVKDTNGWGLGWGAMEMSMMFGSDVWKRYSCCIGLFRRHRCQLSSDFANSIAVTVTGGLYVCLSVCLSRSCKVLKWQKISTRFILHTTAPCVSQIALKLVLHRSTIPPQLLPQGVPSPVDFSVGDIQLRPYG